MSQRRSNMMDRRPTTDRPPPPDQGVELQERPNSRLRQGLSREKQIMFHRPERRVRRNMEAPKKQKILMAYENKPRCCMQLLDQIGLRWKHLFRNSCCSICAMLFTVLFTAFFFFAGRQAIKPKEFPEFELGRLKHPLYQTSYLQPEEDIWYADY